MNIENECSVLKRTKKNILRYNVYRMLVKDNYIDYFSLSTEFFCTINDIETVMRWLQRNKIIEIKKNNRIKNAEGKFIGIRRNILKIIYLENI